MQQTSTQASAGASQGAAITESEYFRLTSQRTELQTQLKTLSGRRNELTEQRNLLSAEDGRDHTARIKAIDQRSAQIDRELMSLDVAIAKGRSQPFADASVGDASIATAVAREIEAASALAGQSTTQAVIDQSVRDATQRAVRESVGMSAFVIVAGYVMWRGVRRLFARPSPVTVAGDSRRFEQLQQSIDVIALEVERMSESQRFIAKVLNEKLPALGVGDAKGAVPAKR